MDYITAYAIYITVAILVVGLWATRVPHEDVGVVFILALVWPVTIFLISAIFTLDLIGWNFEMVKGNQLFGFRRPTNPNAQGFAVTVFGQEMQVFKMAK